MKKLVALILAAIISFGALCIVPTYASAVNNDACNKYKNKSDPNYKIVCGSGSEEKAENTVKSVLQTVFLWTGIVAVIVIVIGGIFYTISQGDPGKIKKAKDTILYAIIGLIVSLLSFAIVTFVLDKIQ